MSFVPSVNCQSMLQADAFYCVYVTWQALCETAASSQFMQSAKAATFLIYNYWCCIVDIDYTYLGRASASPTLLNCDFSYIASKMIIIGGGGGEGGA